MDNILLVLGITEGRKFPKRNGQQLLVEAKFDGEVLTTDLVKHENNPQFQTELAWEIDKKSLHQHRMQRTPIKVQVYAITSSSSPKDLIGYFVLDLRSAQQEGKKKAAWHPLLSSKYQSIKPELKTLLTIESDPVKEQSKLATTKERPKSPIIQNEQFDDHLDVVLDDEKGYYLIGPEISGCVVYSLSISIGGAKNLVQLLSQSFEVFAENGFYFYYSLLDNDVTNETFYDLIEPNVPMERATVRLCTTPKRLQKFLKRRKQIDIFLCSGSTTLGQTSVSLSPLFAADTFTSPLTIEGLFTLSSSSIELTKDEPPVIGVSIALSNESYIKNISPVVANQKPVNQQLEMKPTGMESLPTNILESSETSPILRGDKKNSFSTPVKPASSKQIVEQRYLKAKERPVTMSEESANHHFIFSIDIRSITNTAIDHPLNCVCRYTYPFFGSSSPVLTNPPVYVQRHSEVLLPQSFCKFEFASTVQLLQSTFSRVPLIIEIWNKDSNTNDRLVGIAQVHLTSVFFAQNKTTNGPIINSEKVAIISSESPSRKLGGLHVVLGIEDRGVIKRSVQDTFKSIQSSSDLTSEPMTASSEQHQQQQQQQQPRTQPRESQEYQIAMALELWRQQQEEHFLTQLGLKEKERMNALADEWKQRDMERELLFKKKLEEYNVLETKLRNSMVDLEKREKQVALKEDELRQKQRLFEEGFERKTLEMREASRRLKEEYEHQLHLEKLKTNDAEKKTEKTLTLFYEIENKLKERENEIYALKESMLNRPEVKMQSEMNLLLLEKNELERKVEATTKSKIHYKQQWGRALRELARIKVTEQEAAKARLKKQQHELDHMKLRYLAIEEKQVMKSEKEELQDVKEEISKKLEEIVALKETNQKDEIAPIQNNEQINDSRQQTQIAKLIEERDTLLQTGVYSLNDRVIEEIDKEIQALISASHNL